jgi:O-antigen/teichoic acid export membrane protein
MQGLRRSLAFSFLERYGTIALNLATLSAVSHLLGPAEVGVFAVASALLVVTESFRDFGLTLYLVQAREVTERGLRTSFTVSLLVALLIAGGMTLAAGPIASFYGEPRIEMILRILAWTALAGAVSGPLLAVMRREFDFAAAASATLAGTATNFVLCVGAAPAGFGAVGLAWAGLAGTVATAATAFIRRPETRMFRPSLAEWRGVLRFGGIAGATNILNTLYQTLPQLLLGRFSGMEAAGLLARATAVAQLPERAVVGAIQPVLLPAFAAHDRNGGDLRGAYLSALGHMAAVCWPPLIVLILLAEPIVALLLGPQWSGAVPLVRIVAAGWLAMFAAVLTQPALVASGHVGDTLTTSLVSLPISAVLLLIGAPFGPEGLAAAMFCAAPLQAFVAIRKVGQRLGFGAMDVLHGARGGVVPTLAAAFGPAAAWAMAGGEGVSLAAFGWSAPAAVLGWGVALRLTGHPLFAEMVRLLPKKRVSGVAPGE